MDMGIVIAELADELGKLEVLENLTGFTRKSLDIGFSELTHIHHRDVIENLLGRNLPRTIYMLRGYLLSETCFIKVFLVKFDRKKV